MVTTDELGRQLEALGRDERYCLERRDCEALFPPGLATAAGRQAMYSLANANGCDVQWAECAIAFVKRRSGPS